MKNINSAKRDIGSRFRLFRESIDKAQHEIATELNISQSTIANIERGKAFPNINYLHYFYTGYYLNVNWLLTGQGKMLYKGDPINEKYLELMNLMQISMIEQVIFAKLVELKVLLKDEIKAFQQKEGEAKPQ